MELGIELNKKDLGLDVVDGDEYIYFEFYVDFSMDKPEDFAGDFYNPPYYKDAEIYPDMNSIEWDEDEYTKEENEKLKKYVAENFTEDLIIKEIKRKNPNWNTDNFYYDNFPREYAEYDDYANGGELEEGQEIVVVAKDLDKDGRRLYNFRFLFYIENEEDAKKQAAILWENKFTDLDLTVVEILTDAEYRKKYLIEERKYSKGGSVKKKRIRFIDKVESIADRLEGTKVPAKLKKDYGGRYSREEAEQAARRIAGAQLRDRKMSDGGMFPYITVFEQFKRKLPDIKNPFWGEEAIYKANFDSYSGTIRYFKGGRKNANSMSLADAYSAFLYQTYKIDFKRLPEEEKKRLFGKDAKYYKFNS